MKYKMLVSAATLVLTIAGQAQAETVVDALERCKSQQNDLKRLICFDELAETMNIYAGTNQSVDDVASQRPDKPVVTVSPSETNNVQTKTAQAFGLEGKRLEKEQRPQSLTATITDLRESPRGDYIVTLDNGMIWRQKGAGSNLRISEGQKVTIDRGALGAFYLGREGINTRMSVERVK